MKKNVDILFGCASGNKFSQNIHSFNFNQDVYNHSVLHFIITVGEFICSNLFKLFSDYTVQPLYPEQTFYTLYKKYYFMAHLFIKCSVSVCTRTFTNYICIKRL